MRKTGDFSEQIKLRNLLSDSITGLPTLLSLLPDFVKELELNGSVGFLAVTFLDSHEIEKQVEFSHFDEFLKFISEMLLEFRNTKLTSADRVFIKDNQSTDFAISLSSSGIGENERIRTEYIRKSSNELRNFINLKIKENEFSGMFKDGDILVGYSRLVNNPVIKMERQIHYAIRQAKYMSTYQTPELTLERRKELSNIINNRLLNTKYQPIIDLPSEDIIGYEALNRPMGGTGFDVSETLFLWASRLMLDLQLDILCIEQSFDNSIKLLENDILIFINTFPRTVENSTLILGQLLRKSEEHNIPPENVILEMTERTAIEDMNVFKQAIKEYKKEGFKIAIDDVGAGYSSLSTIAHLDPDYLKFDITLVRNIHREPIKQQLLRTVMELAEGIEAVVIAEGIETKEEFEELRKNNVQLGQGYYFGRSFDL